jgi:cold shock CspA family protein
VLAGVVVAFDEHAGHGRVEGDDGADWYFHCTAIADGSRTIEVGARVSYRLVAGLGGRWEAGEVRPAAPPEEADRHRPGRGPT